AETMKVPNRLAEVVKTPEVDVIAGEMSKAAIKAEVSAQMAATPAFKAETETNRNLQLADTFGYTKSKAEFQNLDLKLRITPEFISNNGQVVLDSLKAELVDATTAKLLDGGELRLRMLTNEGH